MLALHAVADYTFKKVPVPLRQPDGFRGIYREVGEAGRLAMTPAEPLAIVGALSACVDVRVRLISVLRRVFFRDN